MDAPGNPAMEAAALAYLHAGFIPLPLATGRKKPPCFKWAAAYGYDRATGTLKNPPTGDEVRSWATRFPDYNLALLTGRAGGFDVIDPDMKPGQDGIGALATLEKELGTLPDAPTQRTANKGMHICVQPVARDHAIGGKVTQLAPDVDTRLDGNYIVVAPSVLWQDEDTRDGVKIWVTREEPGYWMWDADLPPLRKDTLPVLPAKWQAALLALKKDGKAPRAAAPVAGMIPLHQRNDRLCSLAGTMRRRGMSEEAIYQALRVENTKCEIALPDDEVRAIAHSVSSYPPVIEVNEGTSFTDVANANRLVLASGDRIRFCNEEGTEGRWFIFDGKRWASSTQNRVVPFVTDLAIGLYQAAAVEPDADKRMRLSTEAQRLESARCVRYVIDIAKSRPELRVEPRDFDQDEQLLNVENGVLDLRTSTLLPHDPKYLITKLAPVAYDPEARSELWEKTVDLATCGDVTLLAFLRRIFGLTLTGYTSENVFFVLYGPTRSGKTTVVTAVSTMLGDYATTLRVQAILAGGGVDKIPHDLADLRGARLVVTSETPKGKRYDENTIKMLTGGDEVKACFKYGHNFSYYPSMKLFMYTNYRPEFSGGDDAIWARALTVPFLFNFKTYQGHDRDAKDRLREPDARAAVLTWALRGWQSYQKDGLVIPARVTDETAKHRKEVDSVQNFLDERCETVGTEALERHRWVTNRELSQAYQRWSKEQSNPERMSEAVLVAEMTRLGYRPVTVTINHNKSLRYEGLRLRGDRE